MPYTTNMTLNLSLSLCYCSSPDVCWLQTRRPVGGHPVTVSSPRDRTNSIILTQAHRQGEKTGLLLLRKGIYCTLLYIHIVKDCIYTAPVLKTRQSGSYLSFLYDVVGGVWVYCFPIANLLLVYNAKRVVFHTMHYITHNSVCLCTLGER